MKIVFRLFLLFVTMTLLACSYCDDCNPVEWKKPYFANESGQSVVFSIKIEYSYDDKDYLIALSWDIANLEIMPEYDKNFYEYPEEILTHNENGIKCGPFHDNCNYEQITIVFEFLTTPHRCIVFSGPLRSDLDPRQWKPYLKGEEIENYDNFSFAHRYFYTIDEAIYQLATEEACPMDSALNSALPLSQLQENSTKELTKATF